MRTPALAAIRQELHTVRGQLQQRQEERERERRRVASASVKLEAWGTSFFVVGVVLTGIAAVTC
jgi:hypothetical protein